MVTLVGPPGVMINNMGPFPGKFSRQAEQIDARTLAPKMKPDPEWSHIDSNGHFHAWNIDGRPKVFTAEEKFITRVERHCDMCDMENEWEESLGWLCTLCEEKIETPRTIEDFSVKSDLVPGRTSWSVEFESVNDSRTWKLLRVPGKVSVRIPSINGFGIGETELLGFSSLGVDFVVHGIGEFGRHG